MDDGQQWFDFAWRLAWAARPPSDDDEPRESPEKIFSRTAGGGLIQVISVGPGGAETAHWQVRHAADAVQLGRGVARQLPAERVKLRRTIRVVTTIEVEEDLPPERVA